MSGNRTPLSNASSYREIGDHWDSQELTGDKGHDVEFELDLESSRVYVPIDKTLEEKVRTAAVRQGVSVETLLNLWIQERIASEIRGE